MPVLSQTFALLAAVGSREPVRATAHGNLPVVIVKELFAGAFADAEPDFIRVNREDDSAWLFRVGDTRREPGEARSNPTNEYSPYRDSPRSRSISALTATSPS